MVTALRDRVYDRVRLLGSPGKQVPPSDLANLSSQTAAEPYEMLP